MAVYYIDPHTTTNGSGTWASPWSFNSSTRTGLTNGDEIRVRGVALTNLLTATVYTATVTSAYQLTITAGGGLGADFAANDVVYLPDFGTFFRVFSITTNVLSTGGSTIPLPINNYSVSTVTVRKVNTASYPGGINGAAAYIAANWSNLTISDCWVDATTRVTDGSVKTLIYQGNAANTTATTLNDNPGANVTGWSVDFANTHLVSQSNATAALTVYVSASTITMGQIYTSGTGYNAAALNFDTTPGGGIQQYNTTITVNHFSGKLYGCGSSNCTVNLNNCYQVFAEYIVNSVRGYNATVNIGNIACTNFGTAHGVHNQPFSDSLPCTFNYNGVVDHYPNSNFSALGLAYATGLQTVNFNAGFAVYANKRATQLTSSANMARNTNAFNNFPKVVFGKVNAPSGWTFTGVKYFFNQASGLTSYTRGRNLWQQSVFEIELPENSYSINTMQFENQNVLVTFRDGTAPQEYLSTSGKGQVANFTVSSFALVTLDSGTYRTTGPSLRSQLTTRNASDWFVGAGAGRGHAIKSIKVPGVAGVPVTVSGYVRNNITGFADGDVRMAIYLRGALVVEQNMTTASNSAWEQFSLTFTPSQTAEYTLLWDMFYAAAGSIWLDDVSIT